MKYLLLLVMGMISLTASEISKEMEELIAFKRYDDMLELIEDRLETEKNRYAIAELKYYEARGLYYEDELKDAFEILRELVRDYRYEANYQKVLDLQTDISNERYSRSGKSSFFGTNSEAISFYQTLLEQAPYAPGAATAMLRIGMLQEQDDDDVAAALTYKRLVIDYSNTAEAGYARIYLAQQNKHNMRGIHGDLDLLLEAKTQLKLFMLSYKKHPLLGEAKKQYAELEEIEAERYYFLAEFYLREVHYRKKTAKRYLYKILVDFPESKVEPQAKERLAELEGEKLEAVLPAKKADKVLAARIVKQRETEILAANQPKAEDYDRSVRKTLVTSKGSGKYLLPVEDLGLEVEPIDEAGKHASGSDEK